MSDPNTFGQAYSQASEAFSKFVPGFDFLQGLVKNAGKALPSMGQWVAPTLDPAELERRIEELKTVQFWLEQNARMLGATIQALEVQRMTLGALKGMNVSMGDLSEALKVRVPDLFTVGAAGAAPAPAPEPAVPSDDPPATAPAGAVDPMQWWGALTQQFTALATQAMQATGEAARQATEDAATQAAQAREAVQAAANAAAAAAQPMAEAMQAAVSGAVQDAAPAARRAAAAPKKQGAEPKPAARSAAPKAEAAAPAPARKPAAPRRAATANAPARAPRRKTAP